MNKTELINKIATEVSETKKATATIVDAVFETIGDSLIAGEPVSIANFGKFEAKPTAARTCRNIHTGEAMEMPASRRVAFKTSSVLKNAIKGE